MLFDTHVHSKHSFDSSAPPQEHIAAAEKLGLGLIFTEHVDYDLPGYCHDEFVADVPAYLSEYAPLKSPRVLTGLEIGLTPANIKRNAALAADNRLDYVIGSVHVVYGFDICAPEFWRSSRFADPKAAYLECCAEMIGANDFFDSLGHIDYPCRYCPLDDKEMRYGSYKRLYDRIFDALIKGGKVLEINTKREAPEIASAMGEICAAYAGRGGKYVTIGSDAHSAPGVGRNFDAAMKIAADTGLEPVYFRERIMYNSSESGKNMG
ncbi:MAG: histidinol-phosphatase HisJ family protein [Defluviitaleaceae bacterium]|nr:histidinol-phosphatase HisJ family protein [Defluviitaleaceae bacterium]